jgi:hypothetical protein
MPKLSMTMLTRATKHMTAKTIRDAGYIFGWIDMIRWFKAQFVTSRAENV